MSILQYMQYVEHHTGIQAARWRVAQKRTPWVPTHWRVWKLCTNCTNHFKRQIVRRAFWFAKFATRPELDLLKTNDWSSIHKEILTAGQIPCGLYSCGITSQEKKACPPSFKKRLRHCIKLLLIKNLQIKSESVSTRFSLRVHPKAALRRVTPNRKCQILQRCTGCTEGPA